MGAMNPLEALFQSQGLGQQNSPNPLAQMMNPEPPPELTPETPQLPPVAPGELPLDAKIQALTQQVQENIKKLQEPIQSQIPPELADFNKYNEAKYQQTYGGGGVLGTAGRAVANLLSGFVNGGKTIKDTLTEQNRKDWQVAVQQEAQRVQLQKAQLAQATQLQAQELQSLRLQQQMQNQAQQQNINQQKVDISAQNTPEAKAKVEKDRREAIIQHYKDSGEPLSKQAEDFVRINGKLPPPVKESDAPFATAKRKLEEELKRPLTSDELLRLNEHIRFNPYDITREQIVMAQDGSFKAIPVSTVKAPLPDVVQNTGSNKTISTPAPPKGVRDTGVQGNVSIPGPDKDFFTGVNTSLKLAGPIQQKLNDPQYMAKVNTGPLAGRLTLLQAEKAGGMMLSPEAKQLATDLRRLITTEAFANGGKQLTGTEKEEFERLLPQLRDTIEQAQIHLKSAIKFLETKKAERAKTLTPAQRNVLENSGAVDNNKPKVKILKVE